MASYTGIPIVADPSLPEGVWELRNTSRGIRAGEAVVVVANGIEPVRRWDTLSTGHAQVGGFIHATHRMWRPVPLLNPSRQRAYRFRADSYADAMEKRRSGE